MRVLISTSTFPLGLHDGLPRFVYDLALELNKTCTLITLAPGAVDAPPSENLGGVEVRRFDYFRPRRLQRLAYGHGMRENFRASLLAKLQLPSFVWSQVRATRRLVRNHRVQAVNSHWLIPQGLSTALARGRKKRFRHVLSVHAGDVYALNKLPLGSRTARFVVSRSDVVLVDGSDVRDSLDSLLGAPSEATIRPMGVRPELFRADAGNGPELDFAQGYVLFVGRLTEKKGVTYLLRALRIVLESHPHLGLVVIGYGPLEASLREEAQELGIGRSVRFLGRQPHGVVADYLAGCRVAAVPSVVDRHGETDGMPTVVVEAMAAGALVVGTAVDGIPDVIRAGSNGWLCREKDPLDLAEKLRAALENQHSDALRRRARATALEHSWAKVAAIYLNALTG